MGLLQRYTREQLLAALERANEEQAAVIHLALKQEQLEQDYETWLYTLFPDWTRSPLGPHHHEMWQWAWGIKPEDRPPAFFGLFPRGGGKSVTAELITVALGARGVRKYALYVCHEKGTQIYDPSRPEAGWHPVEEHPTAKTVTRPGLSIEIYGLPRSHPEVVTPEHRYWARRVVRRQTRENGKAIVQTMWGRPQWIEAQDLDWNTWIGHPIDTTVSTDYPTLEKWAPSSQRLEEIDVDWWSDPEFWWLVGLWWGDGTLGGANKAQISISCGDAHPEVREKLIDIALRLGWNVRTSRPRLGAKLTDVRFCDSVLGRWLLTWKAGNSRKLPPRWVEQLPLDLQAELLKGYLAADGSVDNRGAKIVSIHLPGLMSVRRMLARLGTVSTISQTRSEKTSSLMPCGNYYRTAAAYTLRVENPEVFGYPSTIRGWRNEIRDVFIKDGFWWSKVKNIDDAGEKEFVPIQTTTEDYLTSYGLSHNCETQPQADKHVDSIAQLLESAAFGEFYPGMAERMVGKYGSSKGWRRNRLRTASGFTIDAIGLDVAARGIRTGENRPSHLVLDDIDEGSDTIETVRKKISTVTTGLIPAGDENLSILVAQNLIHANSLVSQVVDGRADFLQNRIICGPIPALNDFTYKKVPDRTRANGTRYVITGGEPTWEGFDVDRCERLLNDIGPDAFLSESQHDVFRVKGAKWSREQLNACRIAIEEVPELEEVMVFVDPSGGDTAEHDEQGIIVGGRGIDGHCYILADLSGHFRTQAWAQRAVGAYHRSEADLIGVEDNYGGEMCEFTLRTQTSMPDEIKIKRVNARRGKVLRAQPVAALFGDPDRPEEWALSRVHLAGSFPDLENELSTFTGAGKSPNRLDAAVFLIAHLAGINDEDAKPEPFFGIF